MDRLDTLEAQSIYILREAYAAARPLAALWSIGKDSNVVIWLARKAFFGRVPFPVVQLDTGMELDEVYAYRDRYAREWGLELVVIDCPPEDEMDPDLPPMTRAAARKSAGLAKAAGKRAPIRGSSSASGVTKKPPGPRNVCSAPAPPTAPGNSAISPPRILEPVHHRHAGRHASAHSPAAALDRGGYLALFPAREHPDQPALFLARRQTLPLAGRKNITAPSRAMPRPSTTSSPSWKPRACPNAPDA